jgi:metal-dependent hydrolase (beta-lactamase superfamily II)
MFIQAFLFAVAFGYQMVNHSASGNSRSWQSQSRRLRSQGIEPTGEHTRWRVFFSGEIPRKSFERGLGNHFQRTSSGQWEPDPLVMDERFLVTHVKGKGLAIFTGCSHAGIVNVCRHAEELFPATPLYALVGGLHLVYPNEELIEETIAEIKKFGFRVIIPGHCTGWRAVHAFISAFWQRCG